MFRGMQPGPAPASSCAAAAVTVWSVDVWISYRRPLREESWRRYVVLAGDAVEAELVAVQMAYAIHGFPVRSCVLY